MPAPIAPPIETPRLSLRGHTIEDFADSAAMWGDPNVTRFIGGRPFSEEEVWSRLLRYAGHWALKGFGYWVVRERSSGRFVGEVAGLTTVGNHAAIIPTITGRAWITGQSTLMLDPDEDGDKYARNIAACLARASVPYKDWRK